MRTTSVILAAAALTATGVAAAPALPAARTAMATCRATPANPLGPYFTAGAPVRSNVAAGVSGRRLVVTGRVTDTSCRPLRGAVVDLWQADTSGDYDNTGYRLRGKQVTTADGRYTFTTVLPGLYEGRTRHIHLRIRTRDGRELVTQAYLPGVAQNGSDGFFDPALLARVRGRVATFDVTL